MYPVLFIAIPLPPCLNWWKQRCINLITVVNKGRKPKCRAWSGEPCLVWKRSTKPTSRLIISRRAQGNVCSMAKLLLISSLDQSDDPKWWSRLYCFTVMSYLISFQYSKTWICFCSLFSSYLLHSASCYFLLPILLWIACAPFLSLLLLFFDEKEPHSGGRLTALMECAALLGDGQQKCGPHNPTVSFIHSVQHPNTSLSYSFQVWRLLSTKSGKIVCCKKKYVRGHSTPVKSPDVLLRYLQLKHKKTLLCPKYTCYICFNMFPWV